MKREWKPIRIAILRAARLFLCAAGCFHLARGGAIRIQDPNSFFERRIRPVLVEHCHECHGQEKQKAGLRLDHRGGLLKGGDSGPAIEPGDPDKSRLVRGVRYEDVDFQMPPRSRLKDGQIRDIEEWIRMGAPWPEEPELASKADSLSSANEFDIEKRKKEHWAWTQVRRPEIPGVKDSSWPLNEIDFFILNRLEKEGLRPAPRAKGRDRMRRLYYDLIGLPPSMDDVSRNAIRNEDPAAWKRWTASLLASPRFGERWARHWLDLVRYSETMGHEFDYPIEHAWRYRDYVIRAFNQDLPYDQFVLEHIAGDRLNPPRLDPQTGRVESVIGTAFYWMAQQVHSPVDVKQNQLDLIDNQIDVLSKTFLGLTVSCARCHDHKFDPIATEDFYSLYGILASSRYHEAMLNPPGSFEQPARELETLKTAIRESVAELLQFDFESNPEDFARRIDAANPQPSCGWMLRETDMVFVDFSKSDSTAWFFDGPAWSQRVLKRGDFIVGEFERPVAYIAEEDQCHSAALSRKFQMTLRSPTFTIERPFIHIRVAGESARVNAVVESFNLIRAPIYGGLKVKLDNREMHWRTIDAAMWKGRKCYLEFKDVAMGDPAGSGSGPNAWFSLQSVIFSDHEQPPPNTPEAQASDGPDPKNFLVDFPRILQTFKTGPEAASDLSRRDIALLNALLDSLEFNPGESAAMRESQSRLAELFRQYQSMEEAIPEPVFMPSMTDGTPQDEHVFIRGNHRTPGPAASRGMLAAIHPGDDASTTHSGRLRLARRMIAEDNPFISRVLVNRVWHYLMGRGLASTPDDFGVMGSAPTHPELLDWLADWFRREGEWSLKKLIRLIVSSETYQMAAAHPDSSAAEKDPNNDWLHRMRVKRLEGEAIRDSILRLSGRAEDLMFGPSVPTHLTPFMNGRGRPSNSGPLDGNGRRSVYLEVRRNFLSPFMLAFDAPVPFTTIGRRTSSNVPAQALILLNDPFVKQQCELLAESVIASMPAGDSRHWIVRELFERCLSRPPGGEEERKFNEYLAGRSDSESLRNATAELIHVLINSKEFIYLN